MSKKRLHIQVMLYVWIVCCSYSIFYGQKPKVGAIDTLANKTTILELIRQGDSLKTMMESQKAKESYSKAYKLSIQHGYPILRNEAGYKNITILLTHLRHYDAAISLNKQLYQYNCAEDNEEGILHSLLKEGGIWLLQKEHKKALVRFTEVLDQLKDTDYTYLKWYTHQNRGTALITLDRNTISKAKYDYDKAVFYLSSKNTKTDSIGTYNCSIWCEQNIDKRIIQYTNFRKQKCNTTKMHPACYFVDLNLAQTLFSDKQFKRALKILRESPFSNGDTPPEFSDWPGVHYSVLGKIYAALNNDHLAIKNMKTAQTLYRKSKQWSLLIEITEQLATIYKKQGLTEQENEELHKIKGYMEVFHEEELDRQITEIKNQQLLEEKQSKVSDLAQKNEIIRQQKDKVRSVIQFLIWFLGVFGILILGWVGYEKLKFHQLNEKINYNRLRALQISMNPHFLFNSFSTLQNFVLKKDEEKAVAYMKDLSGLLKSIFSSSDSLHIEFNDEVRILKSYVALERGRFHNDFEVHWEIAPDLITANPVIPSMMIQPHVENAIIHGFSHSKTSKRLDLSFSFQKDTHIFVKIKDNGIGRLEATRIKEQSGATIKSLSIATKNIQERMDIMKNSNMGAASTMVFDLMDGQKNATGTEVHVILPIIKQTKSYEPYVEEYNY